MVRKSGCYMAASHMVGIFSFVNFSIPGARIDLLCVAVKNNFQHHFWMIGSSAITFIMGKELFIGNIQPFHSRLGPRDFLV